MSGASSSFVKPPRSRSRAGRRLLVCVLALACWCRVSPVANAAEPAGFDQEVLPFFETYCLRCHCEKKQEGKFRLDSLSREFTSESVAQFWGEVVFRMNSGEMPPEDQPLPKPAELGQVVDWISARIDEGRAARMAKRGPVTHYRLSRDEYANTVYDLLGVYYDVNLPGALNEDPRWHGFERIGSLLSLSPSHIDRYFKAAEDVLEQAFPSRPPKTSAGRQEANSGQQKWLEENQLDGRVRWLLWPEKGLSALNVREPGSYRFKIQLSGLTSLDGRMPHLSIWHNQLKQSVFDQDVSASEDQPTVLDFQLVLSPGNYQLVNEVPRTFNPVGNHTLNVTNSRDNVFVSSRHLRLLNPTGYKLFTDEGAAIHPTLIVDWIEWEGPLTSETDLAKKEGLIPEGEGPPETQLQQARTCLNRFAERAWRRPVSDEQIDPYLKIIEVELAAGAKFGDAYRAAMVGVLTSKNFYYLEEGSTTAPRDQVNDWELASRFSYFLWGSMPDEALLAAARQKELQRPEVLRSQLSRMLGDEKIERFYNTFPRQWLQLHRVGMFPPDPNLYPDYDNWLERSMVLESTHFFAEVFSKNLPLREFLDSNWSMVNPRLARHYGLPPMRKAGFQRVELRPDAHRGGLLSQAAVLSLTSDGTRHRPVHRGVWVSEAIFARTPPSPPPNVEPLEPTPSNKPKATIRDQLEAHATHNTCASCHRKIDPLGFAFDNFDAIGRWRTEEFVADGKGANPPVNASGNLPDGRAFEGPDQFKQLLTADVDRFAQAFVEQLATFALRRVMTIDDRRQISAIAEASRKDDYRLRTLIENLVMSDLFRKR